METKKKLTRSEDRILAGDCGGMAEYFGIDATIVRIGYVLISILSAAFPGIIVYLILMLIMPNSEQ